MTPLRRTWPQLSEPVEEEPILVGSWGLSAVTLGLQPQLLSHNNNTRHLRSCKPRQRHLLRHSLTSRRSLELPLGLRRTNPLEARLISCKSSLGPRYDKIVNFRNIL